ncbi:CCDC90 family protein [Burkholderia glumae]|uniref:CCDC90 family protein n=1 Tax=Burkholderia glumae TaxID=337 RepID=UPI00215198D2|nr:CCDC90 family protein [Burkholderia glumae]
MAAVIFDALKFVKTLESSGVPLEQAEAISDAVRETHDSANVATKSEVHVRELRIDKRFSEMDAKLDKLTVRLGGMILAAAGVLGVMMRWH